MKSFRFPVRQEPRKINIAVIIACMLLSLFLLSLVKSRYCPARMDHIQEVPKEANAEVEASHRSDSESPQPEDNNNGNGGTKETRPKVGHINCDVSGSRSDICEVEGDVRVQGSSNTVFVHNPSISLSKQQWQIRPYARKDSAAAQSHVKEWKLSPTTTDPSDREVVELGLPRCTTNHTAPALVFSVGGFTGNIFHDFTDVLIPLFITSRRFRGEVQFLVSDYKSWWVSRYQPVLKQLSNYDLVDVDSDGESTVRCFAKAVVGTAFHREMGVHAGKRPAGGGSSMSEFRRVLREAYGLERRAVGRSTPRTRLLILCRKSSRRFLNEHAVAEMARSLGFDVRTGEADAGTDVGRFARLVNSADVLLGVHGAGLANMVFLPEGAVVVQVVPFGGLEWIARGSFGEPAAGMGLRYLEYKIRAEESSLVERYSREDPVIRDPAAIHKKGWAALQAVYLVEQDVRPNLGRLRGRLLEALKLVHGSGRAKSQGRSSILIKN